MLGQPSETTFGSKIHLEAYFTHPKYSLCSFSYSRMPTMINECCLLSCFPLPFLSLLQGAWRASQAPWKPLCPGLAPAAAVAAGSRLEEAPCHRGGPRDEGGGQPAPVSLPIRPAFCCPSGLASRDTGPSGTFRADHTK